MMREDLREDAERGEAAAILIASEYPIYGRYGFGPAVERVTWEIDARARFVRPGAGELEMVDAKTARADAPAVHERRRRREPGQIPVPDWRWDDWLGIDSSPASKPPHRWAVLAREAGEVRGYLVYRLEDKWEGDRPHYTVDVEGLMGDSPEIEARLWRYCCEMDWVGRVRAGSRSVGDSLPWLLEDSRFAAQRDRADHIWLRPLDVPALLSARRYPHEGSLTMTVEDPDGYAAGTFTLDGGPDGASCRAGGDPDIVLGAATLGAASLGGYSLAVLARAGLVEECKPGGLRRAASLLSWPDPPWCSVWF
jgi:predicted acetyltransferase